MFSSRPPLPRYVGTWDVQVVLTFLEGLGPLKVSLKLAMLLALTRPSRSAALCQLDVTRRCYTPMELYLLQQSWQSSLVQVESWHISAFRDNELLGALATNVGVTIKDILNSADWQIESVFKRFYHRSTGLPTF